MEVVAVTMLVDGRFLSRLHDCSCAFAKSSDERASLRAPRGVDVHEVSGAPCMPACARHALDRTRASAAVRVCSGVGVFTRIELGVLEGFKF